MDVADLVRRLARRWIGVLAVAVLALAVAAVGWVRTGQTRQTVAAVVIVPPKFGDDVTGQNPLLNLDNNLAQLATVLAQAMQSPEVADALHRNGASGSFTVSTVTGTNPSFAQLSPQLEFTVTGTDEGRTLFTARTIVAQARVQLAALQDRAGVAAAARASLVESAQPTSADVVSGGRLRVAGSLGLGVLVLGLLALLVLDGLLTRRRLGPGGHEPRTVDDPPGWVENDDLVDELMPEPVEAEPVDAEPVRTEPTRAEPVMAEPTAPVDALPAQPTLDDAVAERADADDRVSTGAERDADSDAHSDADDGSPAAVVDPPAARQRPPAKKEAAAKTAGGRASARTPTTRKTPAKRTGQTSGDGRAPNGSGGQAGSRPLRAGR